MVGKNSATAAENAVGCYCGQKAGTFAQVDTQLCPEVKFSVSVSLALVGTTPNGRLLFPLIFYNRHSAAFVASLLSRLPATFQQSVVKMYLKQEVSCGSLKLLPSIRQLQTGTFCRARFDFVQECFPRAVETICQLLHPNIVHNCLYMALTEFMDVLDLDVAQCQRIQDRLVIYFGATDNWVTPYHATDVAAACPRSVIHYCQSVTSEQIWDGVVAT